MLMKCDLSIGYSSASSTDDDTGSLLMSFALDGGWSNGSRPIRVALSMSSQG
jgi:hypothetical protein